MKIPSLQECEQLLVQYKVPENIVEHVRQVTKIAVFLARKLSEKGVDINTEFVERAALLHDLDKMLTLKDIKQHGYVAQKILQDLGYPEVADIVVAHHAESIAEGRVKTWEQKIVNYADKRVAHTTVVTIDQRIDDFIKRYPQVSRDYMERMRTLVKGIETDIFAYLDFTPDQLVERMQRG